LTVGVTDMRHGHCNVNFGGLTRSGARKYRSDHATSWTHVSCRQVLNAFERISRYGPAGSGGAWMEVTVDKCVSRKEILGLPG
jgi:hypothetical protein